MNNELNVDRVKDFKKILLQWVWLLMFVAIIMSCNTKSYPGGVEVALKESGNNHKEIEKILEHYRNSDRDSAKLKAAYFLIGSLSGHYYYESDLVKHYLDYAKLLRRNMWQGEYVMNSINRLYGPYRVNLSDRKFHLQTLKADSAIREIDFAFFVWRQQPWSKQYSFDDFCEYVLPFFVDNEIPEYNREVLYRLFNPLLDSLRKANGSVLEAGFIINEKLRTDGWGFTMRQSFLPHAGPSRLLKYRIGNCHDMADLATYVFRALGIPVGNDFVYQWPDMRLGHNWNVLILPGGKFVPFLGAEDSPGVPHVQGSKKGKVYRQTFESNPKSLAKVKDSDEYIPDFLKSPFLKDITDKYVPCYDVKVAVKKPALSKHVYLAVFNDKDWVPVAWGTLRNDTGYFSKVESGIVYLPVYFNQSGYVPANSPFILNSAGQIKLLSPVSQRVIKKIECRRVTKIVPQYFNLVSTIDDYIEVANKPDFSDGKIIYQIKSKNKPVVYWNTVEPTLCARYRYIRYGEGRGDYYELSLAELAVYGKNGKIQGKVISGKKQTANDMFGMENIKDNNFVTNFCTQDKKINSWVGYDLGKTTDIRKIMFAVGLGKRAPELFVKNGYEYELMCWKDDGWKSIGQNTAVNGSVLFSNVPSNGLYLLHNKTQDVDERVFISENGQAVWF